MKKIVFFLIVFISGTIGMPGCNDCKCPRDKYLDIEGINASFLRKAVATTGPSVIKSGDEISWDEPAYILISYATRTYANTSQPNQTSHWGTAAYACDCDPPGVLGTQEKLKYMTVRTAFDFNAGHHAGSVINDLVTILTTSNSISAPSPIPIPLNTYLSKGPISYKEGRAFQLVVSQVPTTRGPFALDITVELDNGDVYTTRTPVVQLI